MKLANITAERRQCHDLEYSPELLDVFCVWLHFDLEPGESGQRTLGGFLPADKATLAGAAALFRTLADQCDARQTHTPASGENSKLPA